MTVQTSFPGRSPPRAATPRRLLAGLGGFTRRRVRFLLLLAALSFGVIRESLRPASWRRTVKAEFRRALRQAVGGSLLTVLITAALVGVGIVNQALYWLGQAGAQGLIGSVIVGVLIRGIAPVLIGLVLLGRSGMQALAEIAGMQIGGQVHALEAQGLDPFLLLILPRAAALSLACFTLTSLFIAVALSTGFVADNTLQQSSISFGAFLQQVLKSLTLVDLMLFPIKTLGIGLLVIVTAGLTAFQGRPLESVAELLPRGFMRGVLVIILLNVAVTAAS